MNRTVSILILNIFCGFAIAAIGQSQEIKFENEKPIKEDRYGDIEGSPYYFKDWVIGKLMRNDALIYENVELNYNGYSKSFEVRNGEKMVELDGGLFLRVDVDVSDNPEQADLIPSDEFAFQRDIHPKFKDEFLVVMCVSGDVMLLKQFSVNIAKHTVQNVGAAVDFKRFNPSRLYYLQTLDGIELLKTSKKKSVLEIFNSDAVSEYVKVNRLKFDKEEDLIELVRFYGAL